jgi:hypothetical protein
MKLSAIKYIIIIVFFCFLYLFFQFFGERKINYLVKSDIHSNVAGAYPSKESFLPNERKKNMVCHEEPVLESLGYLEAVQIQKTKQVFGRKNAEMFTSSSLIQFMDNPAALHIFFNNCNIEEFASPPRTLEYTDDAIENFCNKIINDKKIPIFGFLENLSHSNDPVSKLIFSIHSDKLIAFLKYDGEEKNSEIIRNIQKKSEDFSLDLASRGFEEANFNLVKSYALGGFGRVEYEKAYQYSMKLFGSQSIDGNKQRIDYFRDILIKSGVTPTNESCIDMKDRNLKNPYFN